MIYELPETVTVGGMDYPINSDFRCILDIFEVMNDVDLSGQERTFLSLCFFYPDFSEMPVDCYQEAIDKLIWFINCGKEEKKTNGKRKMMDWEQDFQYIISPINRIIGHEIRSDKHFHWWSFMSAYMEIGDCLFSQVLHIRQQQAEGKRLSKTDAEWYRKNKDIVDIKTKYSGNEIDLLKQWSGES